MPDRRAEGAARAPDRDLREGDPAARCRERRQSHVPARLARGARGRRLPRPAAAEGVGRPGPEPRDVQRRHRDARALRRCVLRDVLRDAHRRGRGAQAARDALPDRQVPEEGQGRLHRHALVLGSRDGLALLVPDRVRRAQGRRRLRGAQEGLLDDVGRLCRLLRLPDDIARLQRRLLQSLGVRDRQGRDRRRGPGVGRDGAARQPVGLARCATGASCRTSSSSARSATAPTRTTKPSTPTS